MNLSVLHPGRSIDSQNAALAAEIATNLLPLPDILKRYGITKQDLKTLLRDPQFRHEVKSFRKQWHSPLSAKERIRLKALLAVEDGMSDLYNAFCDRENSTSVRLDAYKQLVQLADMGPKKDDGGGGGGGFSISINIPGPANELKTVTLEQQPVAGSIDDAGYDEDETAGAD